MIPAVAGQRVSAGGIVLFYVVPAVASAAFWFVNLATTGPFAVEPNWSGSKHALPKILSGPAGWGWEGVPIACFLVVLSLIYFTGLKGLFGTLGAVMAIAIWLRWRYGRSVGDDDGILGRWIARKLRRFAYRPRSS